jgi:hypothetical protein
LDLIKGSDEGILTSLIAGGFSKLVHVPPGTLTNWWEAASADWIAQFTDSYKEWVERNRRESGVVVP